MSSTLHIRGENGHVINVRALRVCIVKDGDGWFAQGVDIDYAAGGDSVDDVQKRFEVGLAATLNQHLNRYNSIEKFLRPAPSDLLDELESEPTHEFNLLTTHTISDIDLKGFPYNQFAYYGKQELSA